MDKNENVLLDLQEMALSIQGYWLGDISRLRISNIGDGIKNISPYTLAVMTTPSSWGKNFNNSYLYINDFIKRGASALLVDKQWVDKQHTLPSIPILVCENTKQAIWSLGITSRKKTNAKIIQVTGTEGKTTFKYILNYIIDSQSYAYARDTSANLTIPVLYSLFNLRKNTEYSVVEISCADPRVCVERSNIIKPDIAVITNLNSSHMNTHGSIEGLLQHKFESLTGLADDGICIMNEDTQNYQAFVEIVKHFKPRVRLFTYSEENSNANAFLISKKFDNTWWNVRVKIFEEIYEYRIKMLNEHIPLTGLGALLVVKLLGLNIKKATDSLLSFRDNFISMGTLKEMSINKGKFLFYDQHFSITEVALKSALNDIKRIHVRGKKIAVLSGELNAKNDIREVHLRIAKMLDESDIDMLYTIGDYIHISINNLIKRKNMFQGHYFHIDQVINVVIPQIKEDDLLFIKGKTKAVNLKKMSTIIHQKFRD